jgi:cytochrome P450
MSGLLSSLLLQQKYNISGLLPSVLLISTTALLASFLVHLLSKYVLFKKSQLPPGPRPWPVVGNLLQLSQGGENLHETFTNWGKQYGPLVYLRLGSVHTVVASSPAMVKEFLKTHDQQFFYRPTQTMLGEIVFANNGIAFAEGGPMWRYLRKICLTELFTVKRLQSFQPMRVKEISSIINTIYMESEEGKVVNLNFHLTCLINNMLTQTLFGKRFYGVEESRETDALDFKQITDEVNRWFATLIISDYIPSLRWVARLQGIEAALHALRKRKSQFVQKLITEHKSLMATTDQDEDSGNKNTTNKPKDFMSVLLSAPREDGTGNLDDQTIECVVMELLTAGTETSMYTLEWGITELIRNPMVMKRAQTELETVIGTNRIVEEADLHKLTYLQAVVKEVLRLHPPGPLLLPHGSLDEACQVAGRYDIPPRTRVLVNIWAMGRDPSIWEKPLEFYPERFLQQQQHSEAFKYDLQPNSLQEQHTIVDKTADVKENTFEHLPFGSGKRACPGRPMGNLVVEIVLARLLQGFSWELPNKQDPKTLDVTEKFGAVIHKAKPLHVRAYPKLPAHLYK